MYRALGAAGGFSDEWLNRLFFFWVVDRSRLLRNLWDRCGVRLLMTVALLTFRCTPTLLAPCAHAGNAQLLGAAEQSSASELLANSRFGHSHRPSDLGHSCSSFRHLKGLLQLCAHEHLGSTWTPMIDDSRHAAFVQSTAHATDRSVACTAKRCGRVECPAKAKDCSNRHIARNRVVQTEGVERHSTVQQDDLLTDLNASDGRFTFGLREQLRIVDVLCGHAHCWTSDAVTKSTADAHFADCYRA